jgi:hypothetical protein
MSTIRNNGNKMTFVSSFWNISVNTKFLESIVLQSEDGIDFPISHEAASISEILKKRYTEGQDNMDNFLLLLVEISLGYEVVELLVEFMNHHVEEPLKDLRDAENLIPTRTSGVLRLKQQWYQEFLSDVTHDVLSLLIRLTMDLELHSLSALILFKFQMRQVLDLGRFPTNSEVSSSLQHCIVKTRPCATSSCDFLRR